MDDYANESVTESEFLSDERTQHVAVASVIADTATPTPERSSHRLLTGGSPNAPRLTVNLPVAAAYHPAQPPRARAQLTPVLFTILAFALGALVSLWFFNRSRPPATLPRAQQAAPNATSSAAHLAESSAVDTSSSERSTKSAAEPSAADVKKSASPDDARPASSKDARSDSSARENVPAALPTMPLAARAISDRPAPQPKVTTSGGCALSISKSKLTLRGGGSAEIAVSLGSLTGPAPITASTNDWANIVVFAGARRGGVSTYRVVSVSQRPGTYGVTLRSPCGTKHIAVSVE